MFVFLCCKKLLLLIYGPYSFYNMWSPRNRFPFENRDQEGCSVGVYFKCYGLSWVEQAVIRGGIYSMNVVFPFIYWTVERVNMEWFFNDFFTRVFLQSQVYHTIAYSRKQHHFASLSLEGRTKTKQESESTGKRSFVYFSAPDWHEASRKAAIPVSIPKFSE